MEHMNEEKPYLREVSPSDHNTVGGPLQDLPNTIIEAQRGSVQGAIDLTPVQPRPAGKHVPKCRVSQEGKATLMARGNCVRVNGFEMR